MDDTIAASATATIIAALSLSFVAIVVISIRRTGGRPLISYEPRQRVPWGVLAIIIPVYCVLAPFAAAIFSDTTTEADVDPSDFILNGLVYSLILVGFVGLAIPWLTKICKATTHDLGFPANKQQLGQDIGLGAFACLVSFLPIYAVQFALTAIFKPEQEHPLIDQILEHRSPEMLLVGAVMAVIAAPLFEEFTFRLLLQGWLERREDEMLDFQKSERQPTQSDESQDDFVAQLSISEAAAKSPASSALKTEASDADKERPKGMTFGLPHGWSPILISSLAFGLAHFGNGVSPIPLVLFGIVLGYLYQRTHRLVPSITAHVLFNGYSMSILWLQISQT